MFVLIPPYRKRIYKTVLTNDEITTRINNEFITGVTSGKYGKFSGSPAVEDVCKKTIQLCFYGRKSETIAELTFHQSNEFGVVIAVSPLRHSILLIFLLFVLAYLCFTGSGVGDFVLTMAVYVLMVLMLSIDFFFSDADTIESFIKDRLLA